MLFVDIWLCFCLQMTVTWVWWQGPSSQRLTSVPSFPANISHSNVPPAVKPPPFGNARVNVGLVWRHCIRQAVDPACAACDTTTLLMVVILMNPSWMRRRDSTDCSRSNLWRRLWTPRDKHGKGGWEDGETITTNYQTWGAKIGSMLDMYGSLSVCSLLNLLRLVVPWAKIFIWNKFPSLICKTNGHPVIHGKLKCWAGIVAVKHWFR